MGLAERFQGHFELERSPSELVANPAIRRGPSYQLLMMGRLDLDEDALALALRAYHPSTDKAQAEFADASDADASSDEPTSIIGLAGWDKHVIKMIGFNSPIPAEVFNECVRPAYFDEELKQEAQRHQSHLLLYYAGFETDPLEQYVALTVVATALAKFGAILVLNEAARTAFPAAALFAEEPGQDRMQSLREMPIPILYGGFAKIEIEDEPGVWMRTFGNSLLRLPDLAIKAEGHHQGQETFELFTNMLAYLRESGNQFAPGHMMQIGDEGVLRFRAPADDEWFLESDGEMLVVEKGAG